MPVTAPVANIARGSLHDGPGVRTVVYLKGCGLRCRWCHNPETFSPRPQILYMPVKCIRCGRCIELCPAHHTVRDGSMVFLRDGCTACGRCADACPAMALTLCGAEKTAEEVLSEICRDAQYYASSGGGATFSGGECLLYPDFIRALAEGCRSCGIHTAVETALFVPWENVEAVLPCIDLFFADLKLADPEKHRHYTGQDNARILENLRRLSQRHPRITLRIPVIPGANDGDRDLAGFASVIRTLGEGVRQVELLRYNHLAESKYSVAGAEYTRFADAAQSDGEMERLRAALEAACGRPCVF